MQQHQQSCHVPWNKNLAVGQKHPFTLNQANAISAYLRKDKRKLRDLALFLTAFDTLLRASDLLDLKYQDVVTGRGGIRGRFTIKQNKTGKPVMVGLTDETQNTLKQWIAVSNKLNSQNYLFTNLCQENNINITRYHYSRLIKGWAKAINLDPIYYSTHSMRRTKAFLVYDETKNIEAVRRLLGHDSLAATSAYLNITQNQAVDIGLQFKIF